MKEGDTRTIVIALAVMLGMEYLFRATNGSIYLPGLGQIGGQKVPPVTPVKA